jgi:hypothetical protein
MMFGEDGWFAFAFNLPSHGLYQTWGDAAEVHFYRLVTSPEGATYYYYYHP